MEKINLKDRKILFELDKNSRISLGELSKKIGLKKETTFHRLNKLIEKKVILQFHTISSLYRFGQKAYKIYLKLENSSPTFRKQIIFSLKKRKNVF